MIEAKTLSKRYGRSWALANVSFEVPQGSVLLVAGRNGSGKTTLFRVLTTAARADGGSARIAGVDLSDRDAVRRRTVLLTHYAYAYESLTAAENLRVFAGMSGLEDQRADEILSEVGLSGAEGKPVSAFSAGMRKRLAIARCILQLQDPKVKVVFLDEPYAALDDQGLEFVDDLIRRLHREGKTVAIVSHLLERGAGIATHALLLDAGRLAWSGAPVELLRRRPRLVEA